MKKVLLLIAMIVTGYNVFAFTTQSNWRWRNDDGTETSATWKAAQNTAITLNASSETFRLRVEIYNNTGGVVGLLDSLQYATSTTGPWINLDLTAGSKDFQIAGTSAFVTQGEATTAQLTGVALAFIPGQVMVDSMVIRQDIADKSRTEIEWTIKGTPNTKPGTTYYFREWGSTANALDIGQTYPSLTTATVLAVNFSAFNLKQDKDRVQISWATASEQNNSHFDIERSSNGSVFTKIATVKGNNNSSNISNYSVYDDKPLSGVNYYRIKQVDNDGKVTISGIKSITISGQKVIVKTYPNPTHGDINFILANNNGAAVTATLTNITGKIVHQEVIQTTTSVSNYKLNLTTKLPAGMYVLQLKGNSVSESAKISVQ